MRLGPGGLVVLVAAACAGGEGPKAPSYPKESTLEGAPCGAPPQGLAAGKKRVELRLGPSQDREWIEVAGRGVFFRESPEAERPACAAVDLAPGEHRVTYKVEAHAPQSGAKVGLRVAEWGEAAQAFYDTFRVDSEGTPVTPPWLEDFGKKHEATPRGLYDPCGSIRVVKVERIAEGMERGAGGFPALAVAFTLKVYKFEPKHAPGSAECQKNLRAVD